jgi:hypothetical protein
MIDDIFEGCLGCCFTILLIAVVLAGFTALDRLLPESECARWEEYTKTKGGYYDTGMFREPVWLEEKEVTEVRCAEWVNVQEEDKE